MYHFRVWTSDQTNNLVKDICIPSVYIYLIMNEDEAKLEEKKEETAYLVSPEE